MRLKLSEIYLGFKNKSFKISHRDLPDRGTIYKDNLVSGYISLKNENKDYRLEGRLNATTEYVCVRCLKKFSFNIVHKLNILMVPDTKRFKQDIKIDIVHIDSSDDYVDLRNVFADLIALSEPLKPLCDENCGGICTYCGIEKTSHCNCEDQKDTSVWDKLKNIHI